MGHIFNGFLCKSQVVCSAVMSGPSDGLEADGVAESGGAFSNSNQQRLSITAALKWIREHLSPMLQGFNPTDQTNVDKLLRWSQNTQASLKEHEGCYDNHALIHTGTTEVVFYLQWFLHGTLPGAQGQS